MFTNWISMLTCFDISDAERVLKHQHVQHENVKEWHNSENGDVAETNICPVVPCSSPFVRSSHPCQAGWETDSGLAKVTVEVEDS